MITQRYIEPEVIIFNENGITDISNFAQSIITNNAVDTAVGSCELTLNPSMTGNLSTTITHNAIVNHLKKIVKLNSIISIKIDRKSTTHTFLGRIDHSYESMSQSNNSTQRVVKLNISKLLPKLLIRDDIINSPILSSHPAIAAELGERVKFFSWSRGKVGESNVFAGKPEEAVKWILENCVATNTQVFGATGIGSTGGIISKSFFNPAQAETMKFTFLDGELLFNPELAKYTGTILNYIYACIDQQFYEVFFDTETGSDGLAYNTITIRPKPFSLKAYNGQGKKVFNNWVNFEDLPVIEKERELMINETLGVNDFEMKNVFNVIFSNTLIASATSLLGKFGLQFPIVNTKSIKQYGLRSLTMTSNIVNLKKIIEKYSSAIAQNKEINSIDKLSAEEEYINGGSLLDYLLEKREKSLEWYAFPYFESGQAVWVGDENIKIGTRLFYKDKQYISPETGEPVGEGTYYYVAGVNHSFGYGQFYRTTTRLIRGCPDGYAAEWLNKNRGDFLSIGVSDHQKDIIGKGVDIVTPKLQNIEIDKLNDATQLA